jgi:hypothetical protein
MVLVQFTITYDDVIGSAQKVNQNITIQPGDTTKPSFSNPVTILVPTALNAGRYKAIISGLEIASGPVNTTTFAFQPQIITVSSSCFQFPANGSQGLEFSNNGVFCKSDITGNKEFLINIGTGQIDLTMAIAQLGTFTGSQAVPPWALAPSATWATAQFAYILLTLDVQTENNNQFPIYDRK